MTAEIAVLNSSAVALAADSAVTVNLFSSSGKNQKIYNTTEKLFKLSDQCPIGIMIYGNPKIIETPIEIIIKNFIKINRKELPTVKEFAEKFIEFVEKFFSIKQQDIDFQKRLLSFFQNQIIYEVRQTIEEIIGRDGLIDEAKIKIIIHESILHAYEEFHDFEELEQFDRQWKKK